MYWVAPAITTVDDFPHFQGAVPAETTVSRLIGQLRCSSDASWVHAVAEAAIGLDGPRLGVGTVGAAKDEFAVAGILELGQVGGRVAVNGQRQHFQACGLAWLGWLVGHRVHAQVLAGVRLHQQLQELADCGVAVVPLRAFAGLLDHRLVFARQHIGQ
ncbi:hypothetical protein D3C81_1582600 [compost metagenome]